MRSRLAIILSAALLSYCASPAQTLQYGATFDAALTKGTRTLTGKPGPAYWQNTADYAIHVNFDPTTNILAGEETISYSNNSPDTLQKLIIRLYPNFYKRGAQRTGTTVAEKDLTDGVQVEALTLDDENVLVKEIQRQN
ncbi:MAG TPA: hypothetical protein VKH37_07585 [Ferruginibacter sp.]|nr:hypothetical protein [Ferruginibacter sp.]